VTTLYRDNVVYNNDLNAFPVGYTQVYSASCGVDIDANGWANSVEGNVSRRTYSGRSILAHSGGASYWNVMRNETALECLYAGLALFYWDTNPSGPVLLGNAFRDCAVSVFGSTDGGIRSGRGEGTILERTNITAKLGYNLSGVSGPGAQGSVPPAWQDGSALYRKGNVSAVDGSGSPSIPMPVYVSVADGKQLLVGNQYSGSAQNYFLATGLSPFSNPLPLYRVARFKGYVGHPVGGALIPVANAGTASMTWTVTTSDPWINASVQSNGTVAAESDAGRLAVSVDTTGMSASTHLGTLTLSNGTISIKIGVSVDLASGTPANAVPGAVFSMNPSGGAAPYTANFDALSSTDSDGVIASYYWDFGDGTYGSGVTASHTYSVPGTYTPVLTVTDDSGAASSAWSNIAVSPALSAVSLAGNPSPPVATGTPVTLSATATGGYQVQYKFLVNAGNGWTILRDYQTAQTCEWTPVKAGIYEVKVLAKNLGSVSDYDQESAVLSYPVGLVARSGLKLWLKADAGITTEGGLVSSWADQSGAGNTVVQGTSTYRPSLAENTLNGHPSVRFSGGNQSLQSTSLVLTGGTAFSTFAVFRFNSIPASTYQYTWFNGTDDASKGYGVYMSTLPKLRAAWGGSNGAVYNSTNSVVDQWYRLSSCFDGTNNRLWTNGAPMGTVAKTGSSLSGVGFCVGNLASGSTKGLRGDMSEILVYDRALSDSERAGIDAYLLVRWSATSAVIVERLADALALPDGTTIALVSPKVATVASGVYSDGSYYIEEPDRTCGIKVIGGSVALWDSVTLTGTVATDSNGERVVTGSSISTRSVGQEVRALGMTNRSMKPTGFLTRIWGRVSSTEAGKFTLDDASGAPVAVLTGGLVTPVTVDVQPGYYVAVTGLSGKGDGGITVIRPRGNSDITVFSQ
jgi:PKD repeat protein